MSRSGYCDDYDNEQELNMWRGAVASAIRGKRGQAFLRDMKDALESLPNKRLIVGDLVKDGEVCAMGAVAVSRGMDVSGVDAEDLDAVSTLFDIAPALAAEISFENDEDFSSPEYRTPEQRYERMHKWVTARLDNSRPI